VAASPTDRKRAPGDNILPGRRRHIGHSASRCWHFAWSILSVDGIEDVVVLYVEAKSSPGADVASVYDDGSSRNVDPGGRLTFGGDRGDGRDVDESCASSGGKAKFFGLYQWVLFLIVDLGSGRRRSQYMVYTRAPTVGWLMVRSW